MHKRRLNLVCWGCLVVLTPLQANNIAVCTATHPVKNVSTPLNCSLSDATQKELSFSLSDMITAGWKLINVVGTSTVSEGSTYSETFYFYFKK